MSNKAKAKIFIICLVLLAYPFLNAKDLLLKSNKLVEYKGYTGQWIDNNNPDELDKIISLYSSGERDVISLNGSDYKLKDTIFIPFSQSYIAFIKNKVACSNIIETEDDFIWPLENFDRISSSFGRRWGSFHEGIDIPAPRGTPILAVAGGRVITTTYSGNLGYIVTIEHRENIYTRYCHCSKIEVKEGDIVKKGDLIARVGSTGNSTGNHLHFEVRFGEFPLNPLDFLPFSPKVKETLYLKKMD
jgi:murein DD-endopeptidase MepM/ murein hydrolase activator NlpD